MRSACHWHMQHLGIRQLLRSQRAPCVMDSCECAAQSSNHSPCMWRHLVPSASRSRLSRLESPPQSCVRTLQRQSEPCVAPRALQTRPGNTSSCGWAKTRVVAVSRTECGRPRVADSGFTHAADFSVPVCARPASAKGQRQSAAWHLAWQRVVPPRSSRRGGRRP